MDNKNYLDYTFVVSSFDIDIWGYLKPTALLNICQDVAYMNSASKGLGFDTLLSQDMAWVLSRIKVSIEREPAWHEKIRVRTWHKGQSGIFSLRDYIFFDAENNPIIRVTSSWLIINLETRRISRIERAFGDSGALGLAELHLDALESEAERVEIPTEVTKVAEHRVRYSDMDVNRHVNNAKYMEWACDHSPLQMEQEMALKSFCINFNHETKYNDMVSLSSAALSPKSVVVEGVIDNQNIFAVKLEYKKRVE